MISLLFISALSAPAGAGVTYRARAGSAIADSCLDCDRAPIERALEGTFVLDPDPAGPGGTSFLVSALDLRDPRGEYRVAGTGSCSLSADGVTVLRLALDLSVNDGPRVRLSGAATPGGPAVPAFDVRFEEEIPADPLHVHALRLAASPGGAPVPREFRRGDPNADGGVDLADAVGILLWLFAGLAEPGCRDALDANGDGAEDVSDALHLLAYVFLEGAAPPEPGAERCGPSPARPLGCESYPPCGGGPSIPEGPLASPWVLDPGQSAALSLRVASPEGGPIAHAWSQLEPASPAGSFSDPRAPDPSWRAPAVPAPTLFTLRASVADPGGRAAHNDVFILVQAGNRPPSLLAGPGASPQVVLSGEPLNLTVAAADPDGDPLSFAWSQLGPPAPQGAFARGADSASAVWDSPAVAALTVFTFEVSVTDGRHPPVTGTVETAVRVPAYRTEVEPLWSGCTGCHGGPFPTAGMDLDPGQSHASLVGVPARACFPLRRVLPGDPDRSVLVLRIAGRTCGSRMPAGDPLYFDRNANRLRRIRSWVLAGALDD